MQSTLFHESWWLSAATNGNYSEAIVKKDTQIVGRLPYVVSNRGPLRLIRMPSFTHLLGPIIDAGTGKPQTRLAQRLSITRSLVDQLPPSSYFHQHLDPSLDGGLATVDGLAFQERKFSVSTQFTFEVNCRQSIEAVWASMSQKTRQPIRRAEEKYFVKNVEAQERFTDFYIANTKAVGQNNRIDFANFPQLFAECKAHSCGLILGAFDHDATPVAMTFVVWGHGTMYYLLSTRSPSADYGAVSLLIWNAIQEAQKLNLVLDLDGVYSSGTAKFLSSFGGEIKTRLIIRRSHPFYGALQTLKRYYSQDESYYFT